MTATGGAKASQAMWVQIPGTRFWLSPPSLPQRGQAVVLRRDTTAVRNFGRALWSMRGDLPPHFADNDLAVAVLAAIHQVVADHHLDWCAKADAEPDEEGKRAVDHLYGYRVIRAIKHRILDAAYKERVGRRQFALVVVAGILQPLALPPRYRTSHRAYLALWMSRTAPLRLSRALRRRVVDHCRSLEVSAECGEKLDAALAVAVKRPLPADLPAASLVRATERVWTFVLSSYRSKSRVAPLAGYALGAEPLGQILRDHGSSGGRDRAPADEACDLSVLDDERRWIALNTVSISAAYLDDMLEGGFLHWGEVDFLLKYYRRRAGKKGLRQAIVAAGARPWGRAALAALVGCAQEKGLRVRAVGEDLGKVRDEDVGKVLARAIEDLVVHAPQVALPFPSRLPAEAWRALAEMPAGGLRLRPREIRRLFAYRPILGRMHPPWKHARRLGIEALARDLQRKGRQHEAHEVALKAELAAASSPPTEIDEATTTAYLVGLLHAVVHDARVPFLAMRDLLGEQLWPRFIEPSSCGWLTPGSRAYRTGGLAARQDEWERRGMIRRRGAEDAADRAIAAEDWGKEMVAPLALDGDDDDV